MILIRRKPSHGKRRLILPPMIDHNTISPKFAGKSYDKVMRHFLVIARLGEGDCFGVGEDLTKMCIISVKKVRRRKLLYLTEAFTPVLPADFQSPCAKKTLNRQKRQKNVYLSCEWWTMRLGKFSRDHT